MLTVLEKLNNQKNFLKILILAKERNAVVEIKKYFNKSEIFLIYNSKTDDNNTLLDNIKILQYEKIDYLGLKLFLLHNQFDYIIDSTDMSEIEKIKMFNFLISKLNLDGTYMIKDFNINNVRLKDRDFTMEQFNEWVFINK